MVHRIVTKPAIYSGIEKYDFASNKMIKILKEFLCCVCDSRGKSCSKFYKEMFANKDSKESQVSLKTIDRITTIFTNFAKYG